MARPSTATGSADWPESEGDGNEHRYEVIDDRPSVPSDLDDFRTHVRRWLPGNLPKIGEQSRAGEPVEEQARDTAILQRRLWDANLAGILYPREYGGLA